MITEKTLFILGAGASKPYGFPTGDELSKKIITKSIGLFEEYFPLDKNTQIIHFRNQYKYLIDKLIIPFQTIGKTSIDTWLNKNRSFIFIGKLLILLHIIKAEQESKYGFNLAISNDIIEENTKIKIPDMDWFATLYNHMTDELTNSEDSTKIKNNAISFITFNYDRSLEFMLSQYLINDYNVKPEDIYKCLGDI